MRKSITLIELIISIVLIGVTVVAAFGLFTAASSFYTATDRKTVLLNELNYLIDHIDKSVYMSVGAWGVRPAIMVTTAGSADFTVNIFQDLDLNGNPLNTPGNFNDDRVVRYIFDIRNNTVTYQVARNLTASPVFSRVLTQRLIENPRNPLDISVTQELGFLTINNLFLSYVPGQPHNPRSNPEANTSSQVFGTFMQSIPH